MKKTTNDIAMEMPGEIVWVWGSAPHCVWTGDSGALILLSRDRESGFSNPFGYDDVPFRRPRIWRMSSGETSVHVVELNEGVVFVDTMVFGWSIGKHIRMLADHLRENGDFEHERLQ